MGVTLFLQLPDTESGVSPGIREFLATQCKDKVANDGNGQPASDETPEASTSLQ